MTYLLFNGIKKKDFILQNITIVYSNFENNSKQIKCIKDEYEIKKCSQK